MMTAVMEGGHGGLVGAAVRGIEKGEELCMGTDAGRGGRGGDVWRVAWGPGSLVGEDPGTGRQAWGARPEVGRGCAAGGSGVGPGCSQDGLLIFSRDSPWQRRHANDP